DEFFRTGVYRVRKASETYHTSSPSMDISKASNFERFVYDLVGRDAERTRALFHKVETDGGFDLSGQPGSDGDEFARVAEYGFVSGRSTHADRVNTIREVLDDYDITIDTHTADGIKVARDFIEPGVPMIVLETALAAKFNETILEAIGMDAQRPAGFEDIESLPQKFVVMPPDVDKMKAYVATNTGL
ncbi:MAG: threonine synthase, partial [Telluria sp.]